jgi:hypothetical protein
VNGAGGRRRFEVGPARSALRTYTRVAERGDNQSALVWAAANQFAAEVPPNVAANV